MLKQSGEWQSILSRKSFAIMICAAVLIFASAGRAYALTITSPTH